MTTSESTLLWAIDSFNIREGAGNRWEQVSLALQSGFIGENVRVRRASEGRCMFATIMSQSV